VKLSNTINNNRNTVVKHTWKDELRNSLRSIKDIESYFEIDLSKLSSTNNPFLYQVLIPEGLAKRIKKERELLGENGPLSRQFIPCLNELQEKGSQDPIGDKDHAVSPNLIHRYKNRILFFPTPSCGFICRQCFRKNFLSNISEETNKFTSFDGLKNYLNAHPEVNEVILSGGDPLTLSNQKLAELFSTIEEVKTVKYIRIHSRIPTLLPKRIEEGLLAVLVKAKKSIRKLQVVIHINHPDEINGENRAHLKMLQKNGITLLAQSVLMKGVNDNVKTLTSLFEKLIEIDIRPYYLHHPDLVKGAMHFYLPLEEGRKIYAKLRDQIPGWALPHYVVDIPGGEGKTQAFNPESYSFSGKLINRNGELTTYA
jgi:lysine 2,3-aminomutase